MPGVTHLEQAQRRLDRRSKTGERDMTYEPMPIDTSTVQIPAEILELGERLAEHAHDIYGRQRLAEGWRYGPERNDATKENPTLVPYQELPESEKEYDRHMVMETLKAIIALGYRIEKIY
jgi:hypothetical protein